MGSRSILLSALSIPHSSQDERREDLLALRQVLQQRQLVQHWRRWKETAGQQRRRRVLCRSPQQLLQRRGQVPRHQLSPQEAHHLRELRPSHPTQFDVDNIEGVNILSSQSFLVYRQMPLVFNIYYLLSRDIQIYSVVDIK